jgi:hypothetical protein
VQAVREYLLGVGYVLGDRQNDDPDAPAHGVSRATEP